MHEDEHAQIFAFGPERVKLWVGKFLAGDTAANANAAESEGFDRLLDLFNCEFRILQCRGAKGYEPIRLRSAEPGQSLVLHLDKFGDRIPLSPVPIGIYAERLNIDARLIHLRQSVTDIGPQEARRL